MTNRIYRFAQVRSQETMTGGKYIKAVLRKNKKCRVTINWHQMARK
jgi:hypothetical protein